MERMKRIYLCSRVSLDAREKNELVATALEQAGYLVYVPHRQKFNNFSGSTDREIYEQDMAAMKKSDACIIVGENGTDCSMEIGWFYGREVPLFWFSPPAKHQPMFWPILSQRSFNNTYSLVSAVDQQFERSKKTPTLLMTLMRFAP